MGWPSQFETLKSLYTASELDMGILVLGACYDAQKPKSIMTKLERRINLGPIIQNLPSRYRSYYCKAYLIAFDECSKSYTKEDLQGLEEYFISYENSFSI